MAKFTISKEPLQPHFLGVNVDSVGVAAGKLKYCSMKLYLYLMCNSDGFTWNMNPVAFANWLGMNYEDASEARKVRKIISDGIADLKEQGFLREEDDVYILSEQFVPEWLGSTLGTKSSKVNIQEQKVPKSLVSSLGTKSSGKVVVQEQFVPENISSTLGTNCSTQDSSKEQFVPNCYGF